MKNALPATQVTIRIVATSLEIATPATTRSRGTFGCLITTLKLNFYWKAVM